MNIIRSMVLSVLVLMPYTASAQTDSNSTDPIIRSLHVEAMTSVLFSVLDAQLDVDLIAPTRDDGIGIRVGVGRRGKLLTDHGSSEPIYFTDFLGRTSLRVPGVWTDIYLGVRLTEASTTIWNKIMIGCDASIKLLPFLTFTARLSSQEGGLGLRLGYLNH